jgi:hypothetical protein
MYPPPKAPGGSGRGGTGAPCERSETMGGTRDGLGRGGRHGFVRPEGASEREGRGSHRSGRVSAGGNLKHHGEWVGEAVCPPPEAPGEAGR